MSENKAAISNTVVINDKRQGTVARRMRYCGIFDENLLQNSQLNLLMKEF